MSEATIFAAALDLVDPAERAAYLTKVCAGDERLRQRVEALVKVHSEPDDILDAPSPGIPTADFPGISERPGSMIGPYKLMEKIGEGGFGQVFVAEQTEPVKRKVALKVIKPGMDSKQVIARFEAERQALAMMDHPNIARVLDAGTTETGRPYFVMELVRGIPITDYCDQNHLTPAERLELFINVCHAIQHAHQKGIIHRDIKPSNVLVTSHDGKPVAKVIDFGVAKAIHQHLTERTIYTQFAQMIGTPLYMSPEQAEMSGLDIDTRSDIYSLGVLLYELLTGSTPLERKRLAQAAFDEIRRVIREEDPPRPSDRLSTSATLPSLAANRKTEPTRLSRMLKGELDWIVMKASEKDRTRRYETANGFARDIQKYLSDEVVEARPASAGYRLRKFVARNKGKVIASGSMLCLLLVGIAGTTYGLIRATQAAQAERAALDAERLAKMEAVDQKVKAEQAAAAEKDANAQAQKRLTQIEKANELLGSIFENLDPKEIAKQERPLQAILVEKLGKAVTQLEGESIGDPEVVAAIQTKFGLSLLGLGEPGKAIVLLEKARNTYQNNLGTEHPHTINSMNNLAGAYRDAGKRDLAQTLYEESLLYCKARLGLDHPETLNVMNSLGVIYHDAGKIDLAVPLLEETLKQRRSKLGHGHPDTLQSMNNLAGAYGSLGKYDLALPLLEEAFDLTKAKFGASHPSTLKCMNNLASLYRNAGLMHLALPLLEETLKLKKITLGAEHPDTHLSMNNLAAAYWSAKQLDKSIPLFEDVLKRREAKLGRRHPDTLRTVANLGVNYMDAGRLSEALPLLEEAHRASKKHPFLYGVSTPLLDGYAQAGETEKATSLAKELLADARTQLPKESTQLAGQLASISLSLLQVKTFIEAEPLLRECLAIRQKFEADAWTTFNTKSMLGGALLGQKKYTEAEPLLLGGYAGLKQREKTISANSKFNLPNALDRLIQLYTETNKPDEKKKWQAEKDKLPKPFEKK